MMKRHLLRLVDDCPSVVTPPFLPLSFILSLSFSPSLSLRHTHTHTHSLLTHAHTHTLILTFSAQYCGCDSRNWTVRFDWREIGDENGEEGEGEREGEREGEGDEGNVEESKQESGKEGERRGDREKGIIVKFTNPDTMGIPFGERVDEEFLSLSLSPSDQTQYTTHAIYTLTFPSVILFGRGV